MTYANGDEYEGELKDGKMNGYGTYIYKDSDTYKGEWKDGKKHGNGKYIYANGGILEGKWENGKLTRTTEYRAPVRPPPSTLHEIWLG